jgi:agmatine deiminase
MRMPAEWEPHRATWIAWPHHEPDWPGKLGPIPWVYAEIARVLAGVETVEILCHSEAVKAAAREALDAHGVRADRVRLHVVPTDRVWLRDSAPTGVVAPDGAVTLLSWGFNAWAKYDNWKLDAAIGPRIAAIAGLPFERPYSEGGLRVVLEGGGIDVNGHGQLLVTEEWLLSDIQIRNPGFTRADYEAVFRRWLGITETIWLGEGCVGDDTHGHIDDIARFVSKDLVLLAVEEDPADSENYRRSMDNVHRLELAAKKASAGALDVVRLPYPRAVMMNGERLPASYANFYIANGVVIVPTFNDANDRVALDIIARALPTHQVIGIHAVDLVWGLGTLHCLTQQEPLGNREVG